MTKVGSKPPLPAASGDWTAKKRAPKRVKFSFTRYSSAEKEIQSLVSKRKYQRRGSKTAAMLTGCLCGHSSIYDGNSEELNSSFSEESTESGSHCSASDVSAALQQLSIVHQEVDSKSGVDARDE